MAFTVIQAGTALQLMNDAGGLTTLTLPANVTLREDIPPRWAVFGNDAILVNTPNQPLAINSLGQVRVLCPNPPRLTPVLTSDALGTNALLYEVKYTFITQDQYGNILSESDFSAPSVSTSLSTDINNPSGSPNAFIKASNLDISPDAITGRRLYRTTENETSFFQWTDLDGNVLTSTQDGTPDAGLSLLAVGAGNLGTPPHLMMAAQFRSRVWGVGSIAIDDLRYTEVNQSYAWTEDNVFPVPGIGTDHSGITALLPRREYLGIGRINQLAMLTGTDDTDFRIVILSQNLGVLSQESVAVYRDTAYWLWEDGVYSWNDDGIKCLSDGKVRSWFTTDNYFNRSRFVYAFGHIDPIRNKYRLFLNPVNDAINVVWIEYDLDTGTWWGPHKTSEFIPASAFITLNGNFVPYVAYGGTNLNIYQEQATRTDGTSAPIAFDIITKRHAGDQPEAEKYFGEMFITGKAEPTPGVLSIAASVGSLEQTTTSTLTHDLSQSYERLGRVGQGKYAQLEMTNNDVGQDVELYGYEIDPVNLVGRR